MRYLLVSTLLLFSENVFGQDWIKMGKGIPFPNNIGWAVEEHRNDLFLIGNMFYDGYGNELRGFAKWDGQNFISYAGQMPLNPTSVSVFRYRDSLFISTVLSWDEKYWLAYFNETNEKLDTVYNKTLYGPIFSSFQTGETLYVSGVFTKCGEDTTWGFCMFDGQSWHSLFSQGRILNSSENFADFIWYKNKLYVGGNFYIPDVNNNYIQDLAILDNGQLYPFGGGINFTGIGFTSAFAIYKDELYLAGYFVTANGIPVNHIVRWDGNQFYDVGGGADYYITDMIVHKDNLYICGAFTNVGGLYAPGIARWDGNEWHRFTYDDFYPESSIRDMQIYNGELYVTGTFLTIDGDTFNCVAKYNHQLPGDENTINIYMNNINEEIIINYEDTNTYTLLVNVYTVTGQQVKQYTLPNQQGYIHQSIEITGLAAGIYIVEATAGNKKAFKKLLKVW